MSISSTIEKLVANATEGTVLRAKQFLHLGARAAVDQALSRLTRRGRLLRVGRGLYVAPVASPFGRRPPSAASVVAALTASSGEVFAPSGAAAANALGLTTQVPARTTYVTSGPTRTLRLGAQEVELRHAPRWQLLLPGSVAGQVVRALAWAGRAGSLETLATLSSRIPAGERALLASVSGAVPAWLAANLGALAHAG